MHSLQRRQTSRERPDPNRISKAQNRYILRRPADPRSNNVHRGRHRTTLQDRYRISKLKGLPRSNTLRDRSNKLRDLNRQQDPGSRRDVDS